MPRKPTELLQYKIRVSYELSRRIKKLAAKNGRPISNEIVNLLEAQVLAEELGVGGLKGVVQAVQSSSAAFAVQEISKQLGLPTKQADAQPSITKRSDE